ncbi:MAG TPA: BlaI/MecI/CopY family transcriptional regulator [Vicinamibacterales bacterium]|jgi:predicted transcriptional regulator
MAMLTKLEHQIMTVVWRRGPSTIRDIQEALPGRRRPAYTTVQTMVYRLEAKQALRRMSKVGKAHLFAAAISQAKAERRVLHDLLGFFGGSQPIMAHLIETGQLTLDDIREAEQMLKDLKKKATEKPK